MGRPHEERWWAEGTVICTILDGGVRGVAQCTYRDENGGRAARAAFIARAPDMYRALVAVYLEIEARYDVVDDNRCRDLMTKIRDAVRSEIKLAAPDDPEVD